MALNERLEKLIIESDLKFDKINPVSTFYRFLRLCNYLYEDVWNEKSKIEFEKTYNDFHSILFYSSRKKDFDYSEISKSGQVFYQFPKKKFNNLYKEHIDKYKDDCHSNISFDNNHKHLHNRFIYIIDSKLKFNYYRIPQPIDNFVIGNKDVTAFPFHPMLAINTELKVFCAGEISFFWKKHNKYPNIVFLNNISGHYKPTLISPKKLNETSREILKLPKTTSIVCFTNLGIEISGSLKTKLKKYD